MDDAALTAAHRFLPFENIANALCAPTTQRLERVVRLRRAGAGGAQLRKSSTV